MSIKVLIVDDAAYIRDILIQFLKSKHGITNIQEAENGEEAISLFKSFAPDLVFMDIVMPVLSGIEATKSIKKLNANTPIIGLSTLDYGDIINRMLEAGATKFLKKPFGAQELTDTIAEFL